MKKELIDFGLTEKEAEVYLVCLKTGNTTANRISNLANLSRSTTYDILQKLKYYGFVTSLIKDKKTFFMANNPYIILSNLDEKEKKFLELSKEKKKKFKELLPHLKTIQNKIHKKPVAEVFEGIVSLSRVLDNIVENANEIFIIGSQENAIEKIDYRVDRFRTKRKERKIKIRQILEDSREARKEKYEGLTQVKFLKNLSNSREATFIYDDIVVHLIISHELTAIKIKSKEYADSQKIIFEELWKSAKK